MNVREITSQRAADEARFRKQMADFARGELLRKAREERHLSQADAAHMLGVSEKSLRRWEHGAAIRWMNAQKLGRGYGLDPKSLISHESEAEPLDLPVPASTGELGPLLTEMLSQHHDRIEELLHAILDRLDALEAERVVDDADQPAAPKRKRSGKGKA